jgi:DNA-binding GntR family transcriptional regulator
MIDLLFAGAARDLVEWDSQRVKASAQALQAARATGDGTAAASAVDAFWGQLAAACGSGD